MAREINRTFQKISRMEARATARVVKVEALLGAADEARKRATRCGSKEARDHWLRVADDAMNYTDLVLRFRYRGGLPRPIMPTVAEVSRNMLEAVARARAAGRDPYPHATDKWVRDELDRYQRQARRYFTPGFPAPYVPPSVAAVRRALDRHRRITAARVAVLEARIAVAQAFLREDRSWERAMSAESMAKQKLRRILRFEE